MCYGLSKSKEDIEFLGIRIAELNIQAKEMNFVAVI